MTRQSILIAGLWTVLATPVWADLTVTTTGSGGTHSGYGMWQTNQGGEFTLQPGGWDPLPLYAEAAKNQGVPGTFQSFCLEAQEHIYPNTTHAVVFNDRAINGGVGPNGDPLSLGTAWLYHAFQNGTLVGYDYADAVDRHASAAALQNTIWWLEDEAVDPGNGNAFRQMVYAQFQDPKADNHGQFPVAVLNLYAQGHAGDPAYLRQDALVCVPVPGAALLGFLGLGAAGLGLRKRV
jgi:hypothetical protein